MMKGTNSFENKVFILSQILDHGDYDIDLGIFCNKHFVYRMSHLKTMTLSLVFSNVIPYILFDFSILRYIFNSFCEHHMPILDGFPDVTEIMDHLEI